MAFLAGDGEFTIALRFPDPRRLVFYEIIAGGVTTRALGLGKTVLWKLIQFAGAAVRSTVVLDPELRIVRACPESPRSWLSDRR